ncbi:MAG: helix-turn-helix domain-containing protein [Candidatus Coprovivens sp.]
MKKGLEVRLYPSKEQRVIIDRTLGCSRFVYNHVLALKKELWEDYKLSSFQNLNFIYPLMFSTTEFFLTET